MPLTTFLTPLDILVKMESFFFFLDELDEEDDDVEAFPAVVEESED